MMMMIAINSRARERGKERGEVKREHWEIWGEEEGIADYGGMVQPSQHHVAPYVKQIEWGLGTKALRMVAAFWAGFPVEVTQEASPTL